MDETYLYLERLFEWDAMKAARNTIKHGVRFTEAASVFFDPYALFEGDPDHSEDEDHYVIVGNSIQAKLVLVVHVLRGERTRIISARPATPVERRIYEQSRRW